MTQSSAEAEKVVQLAARLADSKRAITAEVGKVIVGQDEVIELLLISLMSTGHSLLVGVPGLAKTLLVSTISETLNLKFNRIQFVPDLMPSDITGSDVLDIDTATGMRSFRFIHGPIFCNVLLADEINRSSPKTQAALLQAMQENDVTVGGKTYPIPPPFLVFATQNPIEQEGTYPLPEAELDRFMFQIDVSYPSFDEEVEIVKSPAGIEAVKPEVVLSSEDVLSFQELVLRVPVPDHVADFAVRVVRSSRPNEPGSSKSIKSWVSWGAGPRASQFLILGAKARALLDGRYVPSQDDVRAMVAPVLKHRLVLSFQAEAEGVNPEQVIEGLLEEIG